MGRLADWRRVVEERLRIARDERAPSLNRLDALVEGFAAGQPVRWTLAGQPRPLPTAVDVAAYRIIQESLTNARRHAPGAAVSVRLRYDAEGVTIEVRDEGTAPAAGERTGVGTPAPEQAPGDAPAVQPVPGGVPVVEPVSAGGPVVEQGAGRTAPGAGAGLGLRGMRKRAEAVGGTFSAGPRPEGGFVVRADLPAPEEMPDDPPGAAG